MVADVAMAVVDRNLNNQQNKFVSVVTESSSKRHVQIAL